MLSGPLECLRSSLWQQQGVDLALSLSYPLVADVELFWCATVLHSHGNTQIQRPCEPR